MLTSVCIGANDLVAAGKFYDQVLQPVGMIRTIEVDKEIGYGLVGEAPSLWVLSPYDQQPATSGNGTQLIFKAPNMESVNLFYTVALQCGGSDEGAPGPRDYQVGYYGAYCRDLDGNKLHAFYLPSVV